MNELMPTVSIYKKPGENAIYIMHYAPIFDNNGIYRGDGCWGDLSEIPLEEFRNDGLSIVTRSFNGFSNRRRSLGPNDKQGFDLWPAAKRRRFFAEHADVGITLSDDGGYCVDVMRPRKTGVSGVSEQELRVIIPSVGTPLQFSDVVLKMLER